MGTGGESKFVRVEVLRRANFFPFLLDTTFEIIENRSYVLIHQADPPFRRGRHSPPYPGAS